VATRATAENLILLASSSTGVVVIGKTNNQWQLELTGGSNDNYSTVDTGLFCVRMRRISGGNRCFKTTGTAELTDVAGTGFSANRIGASNASGIEVWNTATTTRYRGLIMLKADIVNVTVNGTAESDLQEAWIAANWGIGP
jgi:hypothetical protein